MSDNRTPEQIEEELRRARQDMQDTVDQLAAQLDPKVKVQEFKDTAKVKSQEFKECSWSPNYRFGNCLFCQAKLTISLREHGFATSIWLA